MVRYTKGPKKVKIVIGSAELLTLIALVTALVKHLIG